MKTRIDIASREASLRYVDRVARDWSEAEARDIALPDGHPNATRVRFYADSGAEVECGGRIGICCPWTGGV